jgi:hypothetical protein
LRDGTLPVRESNAVKCRTYLRFQRKSDEVERTQKLQEDTQALPLLGAREKIRGKLTRESLSQAADFEGFDEKRGNRAGGIGSKVSDPFLAA